MSTPAAATPFTINVQQDALDLLHKKLSLTTFPDELDEAGWDYGCPLSDIKRLTQRWKSGYDWKSHEKRLNETLPQFTMDLAADGFEILEIHFVHKRSERPDAIPLLFVHGWPGSFMEVSKILPLLVNPDSPDKPAFHVVAPSLPGYGFSSSTKKKGFGIAQNAEIFNKLMLSLGYDEYVAQGGDWGSAITRRMASLYGPKHLKSWHTNFPTGTPPSFLSNPLGFLSMFLGFSAAEKAGLQRATEFQDTGSGYFKVQSTRPQTIGYSLQDSPVGLLAWIYEKLVNWSDSYAWDDDEVLTWISVYWFSRAGPAASVRIYYEATVAGDRAKIMAHKPSVPHGVSYFPKELMRLPHLFITNSANVVFKGEHERGGHFAAYERPEELVGDLRSMFGKGGPAFGVVSGKTGY